MTTPDIVRLDTRFLHGGAYVVREHPVTELLLAWPRRLPFGDVTISTDRSRSRDLPRLKMKVNSDWSITVDTVQSTRGLGMLSFPVLRKDRMESIELGRHSRLTDFTISPVEGQDLAVLLDTESLNGLARTRIIFVAPKADAT